MNNYDRQFIYAGFIFELPSDWFVEQEDNQISICRNNGEGAITISVRKHKADSLNSIDVEQLMESFLQSNGLRRESELYFEIRDNYRCIYCTSYDTDGWFTFTLMKAYLDKLFLATYVVERATDEYLVAKKIIKNTKEVRL